MAAVAEFGMLLNNSAFKQGSSFNNARKLADGSIGKDEEGYRKEFIELISKARRLSREEDLSKTEE